RQVPWICGAALVPAEFVCPTHGAHARPLCLDAGRRIDLGLADEQAGVQRQAQEPDNANDAGSARTCVSEPSAGPSVSRFLAFSLSRFLAFSLSRFLAFSSCLLRHRTAIKQDLDPYVKRRLSV